MQMDVDVWGIVNVTPDSFNGGTMDPGEAADTALRYIAEGASVVDIGAQSTRPRGAHYGRGYEKLSSDEEWSRLEPVLRRLQGRAIRISVDTFSPLVAARALGYGVSIINDVSCAASTELLVEVAKEGVDYVLMHNREDGGIDLEGKEVAPVPLACQSAATQDDAVQDHHVSQDRDGPLEFRGSIERLAVQQRE